MKTLELERRWLLVTGASSGLGREIARRLALEHRANLYLAARRLDRLEALRDELSGTGVEIVPLAVDLSRPSDAIQLAQTVAQDTQRPLAGAVLNAGITYFGHALDESHEDFEQLLNTNIHSQVLLAKELSRAMLSQKTPGGLLMVSSLTCLTPFPYQATYGATKSFLTHFGRGLGHELEGTGISVTVFSPGGIATEMLDVSGMSHHFGKNDFGIMGAELCARLAVKAFVRRKSFYIPGFSNQLLGTAMKLLPHSLVIPRISGIYRKAVHKKQEAVRKALPE